ncbi:MAG: hypothetical protein IJ055_00040 [Oscillospiraceae bacterium]|nr:hypothetical protein [Oscillospiraceae bacterium]
MRSRRIASALAALTMIASQAVVLPALPATAADTLTEAEPNDTAAFASPMLTNGITTGSLSSAGDIDYYTFTLEENSKFDLALHIAPEDVSSYTNYGWLVTLTSGDTTIYSCAAAGNLATTSFETVGLKAGTYTVKVAVNGKLMDCEYQLMATAAADPTWEAETNDTTATATLVTDLSATMNGTMFSTGNGGATTDQDFYKIVLDNEAGHPYDVTMTVAKKSGYSSNANAKYFFLDEMGNEISLSSTEPTELDPGVYYVRFTRYSDYNIGYTFSIDAKEVTENREREDNGSKSTANTLVPGESIRGRLSTSTDEDYYAFTLEKDAYVTVGLTPDSGNSTSSRYWNFKIEDESGTVYNVADVYGSSEQISRIAGLKAGKYYIHVSKSYNGSTPTWYTVSLTADEEASFEHEQNGTAAEANTLPLNGSISGFLYPYTEIDYYTFTLDEPKTFALNFTHGASLTTSQTFWKATLTGEDGTAIYTENILGASVNNIETIGLDKGTYTLKIEGVNSSATAKYTLQTVVGDIGTYGIENNDTKEHATVIADVTKSVTGRIQREDDEDWYKFTLSNEDGNAYDVAPTISLPETVNYASGASVTVTIYDEAGNAVKTGSLRADNTSVTLDATELECGTYYMQVTKGYYHTKQTYTISVGAKEIIELREKEINDTNAQANELPLDAAVKGRIGSSTDKDVYKLTIDQTSRVDLSFNLESTTGSSRYWTVTLTDAEGTQVDTFEVYSNAAQTVSTLGLKPGDYYVTVEKGVNGYSDIWYTLTATADPDTPWEGEPNNIADTATPLPLNGRINGRTKTTTDSDYYSFTLEEDAAFDLSFDIGASLGSSNTFWKVAVYDADGQIFSDDIVGTQAVTALPTKGLKAGTYYLAVTPTRDQDVTYILTTKVETGKNWEGERNNRLTDATAVDPASPVHGYIHAETDEDWYSFTLKDKESSTRFRVTPQFLLESAAHTGNSSAYWNFTLCDKDGATIATTAVGGYDTTASLGTIVLDQGTYYLHVTAGAYTSDEPYTIELDPKAVTYTLGDVNEDGAINANDAAKVLMAAARIGAKKASGLTELQTLAANVDRRSDAINANDASFILRYAAYRGAKGTADIETYFGYKKPEEEQPAEEDPTDENPSDENPSDENPSDENPSDEDPSDETPADENPSDETPSDENPSDEDPAAA